MRNFIIGDLLVRAARPDDLKAYIDIQKVGWKNLAVAEEQAKSRFKHNINGILVAEYKGSVVGSITTIRINEYDVGKPKSWYEVTDNGMCTSHKKNGKICFGVDLSVATDRSPRGTVDALFVGCLGLVIEMGVAYFMLGGRMPKYHLQADKYAPEEYLYKKTDNDHYLDPQVDMYSRVPLMKIMGLAPDYFKDPESLNYGVILRWKNPFRRLPFKIFWANGACWLFEKYLAQQSRTYKKRLEKVPL